MKKLLAFAALGVLGLGTAKASDFSFSFTDGAYTGSGYLQATNNGGGNYTVTAGWFNPSYNRNQATWALVAGSGPTYDNLLFIQRGKGYLDGLGLQFAFSGVQNNPPLIGIWDGTQLSNTVPPAGQTYSFYDQNDNSNGDGKGDFVLTAVPEPAPFAVAICAFGQLFRRRRRT